MQTGSGRVLLVAKLRQHLLLGFKPVLLGASVSVPALLIKFISTQADFRFQVGTGCGPVATVFRHLQYSVLGLGLRGAGGLCSSHCLLLNSSILRMVLGPHIDATTQMAAYILWRVILLS